MDCVFTWVDGADPVLRKKRESYLTDRHEDRLRDVAGEGRYVSGGEIYLAVASVLRFAPFIDRIFVITDGQDPKLDAFISKHFPERRVKVIIVDHKEIFKGFESYLPIFNSLGIETLMWQIPGLGEEFIYMNDDFFFVAPCVKEDFFRDGKAVCPYPVHPVWVADFLNGVRPRRADGKKRFTYKDSLRNGAVLLGMKHYYHLWHSPIPLLRSVGVRYFREHSEDILLNIRSRFRDNCQYNVQHLWTLLQEREDLLVIRKGRGEAIQLRPLKRKRHYMRRKLREIGRMPRLKFACMNALDECSEEDRRLFWEWASALVGVPFEA